MRSRFRRFDARIQNAALVKIEQQVDRQWGAGPRQWTDGERPDGGTLARLCKEALALADSLPPGLIDDVEGRSRVLVPQAGPAKDVIFDW